MPPKTSAQARVGLRRLRARADRAKPRHEHSREHRASYRRPRAGTRCWCAPRCRRAAARFVYLARFEARRARANFSYRRVPVCWIHAVEFDFGLIAFACRSRTCMRRRVRLSGGWLDPNGSRESSYVYIPLLGTLQDDAATTPGPCLDDVRRLGAPHCPWCGTPLEAVADDIRG